MSDRGQDGRRGRGDVDDVEMADALLTAIAGVVDVEAGLRAVTAPTELLDDVAAAIDVDAGLADIQRRAGESLAAAVAAPIRLPASLVVVVDVPTISTIDRPTDLPGAAAGAGAGSTQLGPADSADVAGALAAARRNLWQQALVHVGMTAQHLDSVLALTAGLDPQLRAAASKRMRDVASGQVHMVLVVSGLRRGRLDGTAAAGTAADDAEYGPLTPYLRDPDVSEILVNGPDQIYVERSGRIVPVGARFVDELHLRRTIDVILARVGRGVDEVSPMADARLPDGSRVNVIVPPLAVGGALLTIRKVSSASFGVADLAGAGTPASARGLFVGDLYYLFG